MSYNIITSSGNRGGLDKSACIYEKQTDNKRVTSIDTWYNPLHIIVSAVSVSLKCDEEKMPMEKKISCCGMICSDCEHYPADCQGCREIKGKVFWLEYTGESCCDIYECCINRKTYEHCGQCVDLPCSYYENNDPTKTKEENEADHCIQMKNLKEYR